MSFNRPNVVKESGFCKRVRNSEKTFENKATYEIFCEWFFVCCQVLARFLRDFKIISGKASDFDYI
jgi:hypothetical protein